jgi:hypothetical protein
MTTVCTLSVISDEERREGRQGMVGDIFNDAVFPKII